VFQGDGIADMAVGADRIQPHHIARHPEVDDQTLPLGIGEAGLEAAEAYRVEVLQRVVGVVQAATFPDPDALADQRAEAAIVLLGQAGGQAQRANPAALADRKSTRLNSSHVKISYAVFCLKKKKRHTTQRNTVQPTPARKPINDKQN